MSFTPYPNQRMLIVPERACHTVECGRTVNRLRLLTSHWKLSAFLHPQDRTIALYPLLVFFAHLSVPDAARGWRRARPPCNSLHLAGFSGRLF